MNNSESYQETFGALPSPTDVRDFKLKANKKQAFPKTFQLDPRPVKNQGQVSSCVAHSLAEVIEYHDYVQNNCARKMSTGYIYGNRLNTQDKTPGMYIRDGLKAARDYGDCYKIYFRENAEVPRAIELFEKRFGDLKDEAYKNRISSYFRLNSPEDIKTALMQYGPIIFTINWYEDLKVDSNGVIQSLRENPSGCHCMMLYGWNESGWLIQNSWGICWGDMGRAILPYDYPINEAWGISDDIVNEDVIQPFRTKIGKFIAKIINKIVNFAQKKK